MLKTLGVLSASVVLALVAAPASAQSLTTPDPTDDTLGKGLDMTRIKVVNRDYAIVVKTTFVKSVRGEMIASIDPRKAHGLRLVSDYRPKGETKNFVVAGAFTDKGGGGDIVKCKGFRVRWSTEEPTVTMKLPSRCLRDGDYGAVRAAFLTEGPKVSDVDYAPNEGESTDWIPRG